MEGDQIDVFVSLLINRSSEHPSQPQMHAPMPVVTTGTMGWPLEKENRKVPPVACGKPLPLHMTSTRQIHSTHMTALLKSSVLHTSESAGLALVDFEPRLEEPEFEEHESDMRSDI